MTPSSPTPGRDLIVWWRTEYKLKTLAARSGANVIWCVLTLTLGVRADWIPDLSLWGGHCMILVLRGKHIETIRYGNVWVQRQDPSSMEDWVMLSATQHRCVYVCVWRCMWAIPWRSSTADVVRPTVWVWRSEGCRAARTQPDNKGFSTPVWGRSTRASILSHTHTSLIQKHMVDVHTPTRRISLFLGWMWGCGSRLGSVLGRGPENTPHLPLKGPGLPFHIHPRLSALTLSYLSLSHTPRIDSCGLLPPHPVSTFPPRQTLLTSTFLQNILFSLFCSSLRALLPRSKPFLFPANWVMFSVFPVRGFWCAPIQ